ncbi:MAG TPA: AMIN domain-containing protein [Leptolyngbyaceae cyanobacterium]
MSKAIMSNNIQGSKQLFGTSLCVAITLFAGTSIAAVEQIAKLNNWRFYPDTKKLEITLSSGKTPQYFYLNEPPRLVVDIPDTQLGNVSTQEKYTGPVQRVRVSQMSANVTRIVLDLAPGSAVDANKVQLKPVSPKNSTRWVLHPTIVKVATKPSSQQPTNVNSLQLPSTLPSINATQQPFVTVPPLNANNPTPQPNTVVNANSSTPPAPTLPNFPVIEFGQPLPKFR